MIRTYRLAYVRRAKKDFNKLASEKNTIVKDIFLLPGERLTWNEAVEAYNNKKIILVRPYDSLMIVNEKTFLAATRRSKITGLFLSEPMDATMEVTKAAKPRNHVYTNLNPFDENTTIKLELGEEN